MRLLTAFTALLGLVATASPSFSATSTIQLNRGGSISGTILADSAERVIVDLGFTVLTIPREAIMGVSKDKTAAAPASFGTDLYRADPAAQVGNVKDLVNTIGDRVALVRTASGLGSGFVIHPDGYLITNDHVIAGETEITVTLFANGAAGLDKQTYENIRIIASNSELDIALLKIETPDKRQFPTLPLGDSDDLKQGQPVFAIGAPLGLERSVSQGIISLRNRLDNGRLYIQTTTQINPGNSGGPLFNLKGEVVGINNMKIVAAGAEGLGFAIPSTVLKSFLKNRDTFAFDPTNPNSGFRYAKPPKPEATAAKKP